MSEETGHENAAIYALLSRKPVYRTIASRSAVTAGVLSILTWSALSIAPRYLERQVRPREFASAWIIVFVIALAAKRLFESKHAPSDTGTSGNKVARALLLPNWVVPIAYTGWFFTTGYLGAQELTLVLIWITFYGLGLLSLSLFAPRGLVILGWLFLLTGLSVPVLSDLLDRFFSLNIPNALMGISFGVYHLIYGALGWTRKTPTVTPN